MPPAPEIELAPPEQWPALMQAAQHGDADAYARLLHATASAARILLRGKTPPHRIEDIVQDVLLTIHRVRHTYDPARPFMPWLVAIVQRRTIDAARRQRRVAANEAAGDALDNLATPDIAPSPPEQIDAARQAVWLRAAIDVLPRRQRAALQLVKLDELTIAEAAARTGQTQGAVKVNVHRGLLALRRLRAQLPPSPS